MQQTLAELRTIMADIAALYSAESVMSWDQETYMPPGGAEARARHLSALARMAHERFVDDRVGRLLEQLGPATAGLDFDSFAASYLRVTKREYEQATRLPSRLVAELARETSLAEQAWKQARQAGSFQLFQPHLERVAALTIEKAECLGYQDERYDALLDQFEPGMATLEVARVFADLKKELVPLVQAVADRKAAVDAGFLHQFFDKQRQWDFTIEVLRAVGFDLERGRQDVSEHPFSTAFSFGDVRITTRISEHNWTACFFSMLHEAGHGIHSQGLSPELEDTPLAGGGSLGIAESQSRLWENVVGRSHEFWEHFLPKLKNVFPEQLTNVDLNAFYQAVNRVELSPIRTEADELTYNLHIFVRFDLERELVAERLAVKDLPEAWNAKMQEYLGFTPDNDAEGVLQDIHWSGGMIGYFPTYALGNVMALQFYEQALQAHPEISEDIRRGRFDGLREWSRQQIHQSGCMFTLDESARRVTGRGLDSGPYLNYLRNKYEDIYGV